MKKGKNQQLVFGRHPVLELLQSGDTVERVFLQAGLKGEVLDEIRAAASVRGVHVSPAPVEKLNRLTRGNHQGVVAIRSLIQYFEIQDIIMQCYDRAESPLFLLTDGVTDVRNLGAIARSAECFGVHALIHPLESSAQINGITVKASAGALNILPVCRVNRAADAVKILQQNGIRILCASEQAQEELSETDFTEPCCIVMGAEDHGISQGIVKKADRIFKIPMRGHTNSFNVSVAAGIILYAASLQRSTKN